MKDAAYGDGYVGYTEPGKFVPLLASLGVTGTPIRNDDPLPTVRYALTVQQPVLARTFEPEGYFHWTPVIGLDADTITRHQVLGGGAETLPLDVWLERYAGWLFVLAET